MREVAACAMLILTACGTALAATTGQGTVGGWSVTPTPSDGVCVAGRQTVDKAGGKKSAIVYGLLDAGYATSLIVTLSYQDWHFKPDEPIAVELVIGDQALAGQASWVGDAETLSYTFNNAGPLLDLLGAAPAVTVRLARGGEATFPTPNAAPALAAARTCLSAK